MGRNTGPKCKLCRREGTKLFLKGNRCETAKCSVDKRNYPPGMQTRRRRKFSEYGLQLREKQKVKRFYGLREEQFMRMFKMAEKLSGNTGENFLMLLERRLDNCLTVMGFTDSRSQARQFISHGHIKVNDKKVDIPSHLISTNDAISVSDREKSKDVLGAIAQANKENSTPSWLEVDFENLRGKVISLPTREDISVETQEQLIVELCSK